MFWTFVVSAIIVAVVADDGHRTVVYAKHKGGRLVCYQDKRNDGGAFWTYANEEQRRPYVFHCPSSLSAFCVNVLTGNESVRGCSAATGVNRAGCFRVIDGRRNVTSDVCLCKRSYCNAAAAGPETLLAAVAIMAAALHDGLRAITFF